MAFRYLLDTNIVSDVVRHPGALGLTLVTGNAREFMRVPGLAVENWLEP